MKRLIEKLRRQRTSPTDPYLTGVAGVDVLGVGECSLDHVYSLEKPLRRSCGDKGRILTNLTLGGGQVATALCALERLGVRTAFCGAVGDDSDGQQVLAELGAEGVAIEHVATVAGARTRAALLLIDPDGERTVLERRDDTLQLPPGLLSEELVRSTRVLHVDATFAEASLGAAKQAVDSGRLLSIDVDRPGPFEQQLIELADLCVVPRSFVSERFGDEDFERATLALAAEVRGQLIVTRGAAGSVAVVEGKLFVQPALTPPDGVQDTTACGDTFRAALIAYLLESAGTADTDVDNVGAALRFASAAAALKCQAPGRRGCPTRAALGAFLSQEPAH